MRRYSSVATRGVDSTTHALERSKAVDLNKSLAPSMHSVAQRILHELHGKVLQHLIIGLKHVLAHHLDSSTGRGLALTRTGVSGDARLAHTGVTQRTELATHLATHLATLATVHDVFANASSNWAVGQSCVLP